MFTPEDGDEVVPQESGICEVIQDSRGLSRPVFKCTDEEERIKDLMRVHVIEYADVMKTGEMKQFYGEKKNARLGK